MTYCIENDSILVIMINKDSFSFKEMFIEVFKYKDIEFESEDFKFLYWRDYDGNGRPEPVIIENLSDFPGGLIEGKYSLVINTAKITNLDENPFNVSNICVVAKFMKNI